MATFQEIRRIVNKLEPFRRKCKYCHHSMYIFPTKPKRICSWCGRMNYYDQRTEFKERLRNA